VYFITAREASAESVYLWVAAVDEPAQTLSLAPANLTPALPPLDSWTVWPPQGPPRVRHWEVQVTGLTARKTYAFALLADNRQVASAQVTTLPNELPVLSNTEKPFTVLLGSCFAQREDSEGKVGNTFFHMPHPLTPDIKVLAGDQVYLDSPWWKYLANHYDGDELRDRLLAQYTATWGQKDGFARLLGEGANFFTSDDHEYWNNAPNAGAYVRNTWQDKDRKVWLDTAKQLYRTFQTPRSIQEFTVAPLSFFIVDTRINRDSDQGQFLPKPDFERLETWVKSLRAPGVLVIGQPIFWRPVTRRIKGSLFDWNLPDFKQYQDLVAVLSASPNSIIILTGDVHFGRVAYGRLRSGAELVEIISSPLSLVDKSAGGEWDEAPPTFPAVRPEDVTREMLARSQVITEASFQATDSHFLTLEFARKGGRVNLNLRYWPMFAEGKVPRDFGQPVWNRTFT
jgi:hypothetical protein